MDDTPGTCETVRFIGVAGSLITPVFADEVQRRICRTIVVSYGSTEAGKTAAAPFERLRGTPGAVGYVLPGRRVEIVGEDETPLRPGKKAGAGSWRSPGAAPISRASSIRTAVRTGPFRETSAGCARTAC